MSVQYKKITIAFLLVTGLIFLQSFIPKDEPKKGSSNLKVLPKNISEEELMTIMKGFNKSLGVKCSFCHAPMPGEEKGLDFASDKNPHKDIARTMMKMTTAINKKYLDKVGEGHKMEHITCVTCHMGKVHPVVSVDSLQVK